MKWRDDFPFFAAHPDLVYLDSAATAQKPQIVLDALTDYYINQNANVHRGLYQLAFQATEDYEKIRQQVGEFVGVNADNVVFTRGTTEALNLVASSFGPLVVHPDSEILVTAAEHHSNFIPWQQLAKRTGAKFVVVPPDNQGIVTTDAIIDHITAKTAIVAVAQVTNVTGHVVDVARIGQAVHAKGGYLVVDGAQAVAHMPVDMRQLGADFYAFSGHKIYGPTGIGALFGKKQLLQQMPPIAFGGEMIDMVTEAESTWAPSPLKFEAGTPNIAGVFGLSAAITYLTQSATEEREGHERALLDQLRTGLQAIPGMTVYGNSEGVSVVSFNLAGVHPHDLATYLDEQSIAVRAGHHCAQPLMTQLNIPATVRASVGLYSNEDDVERLLSAVRAAGRYFNESE
ncbi:aminotransferase class V-fold PLP-dependent enzyme [Lacticaseibacillus saniviri]|uniref:aminotransferase class V-fold PLP-dependent enzyme n=1 Tax=Lacticaseibacillus saniviri TaxID=931533 RepID=UPI001EDC9C03|nr:SufS family cysteine desulfurase [Lacticaseibacillus saniviri]MCG4280831.1 SufS family cysteine desulfurase [Lacticaseibacillus saniviri]